MIIKVPDRFGHKEHRKQFLSRGEKHVLMIRRNMAFPFLCPFSTLAERLFIFNLPYSYELYVAFDSERQNFPFPE
jgi:hypothetical protein